VHPATEPAAASHDQLKDAGGSLDSLDRILELALVLATRMSVLKNPRRTVPSNRLAARIKKQSTEITLSTRDLLTKRAYTSFLPPLSITLSSESDSDEHRLPVLEKHDPTWAPRDLPNPSLIASTPMPQDKSDYEARFDALKHEVEQASQMIVSGHVEESDRRLRKEWRKKRTPVPSVVITNVGGESGARVAEKSPLGVKEELAAGVVHDAHQRRADQTGDRPLVPLDNDIGGLDVREDVEDVWRGIMNGLGVGGLGRTAIQTTTGPKVSPLPSSTVEKRAVLSAEYWRPLAFIDARI
ncbi:hypothetical protein FRC11_014142, partial [Ceratobasidium sp. 423]